MRPVCPKCKGFLLPCDTGVKCFNCGKVIERPDEVVYTKKINFKTIQRRTGTDTRIKGELATEILVANYDEIMKLRRNTTLRWPDICERYEIDLHPAVASKRFHEIKRGDYR